MKQLLFQEMDGVTPRSKRRANNSDFDFDAFLLDEEEAVDDESPEVSPQDKQPKGHKGFFGGRVRKYSLTVNPGSIEDVDQLASTSISTDTPISNGGSISKGKGTGKGRVRGKGRVESSSSRELARDDVETPPSSKRVRSSCDDTPFSANDRRSTPNQRRVSSSSRTPTANPKTPTTPRIRNDQGTPTVSRSDASADTRRNNRARPINLYPSGTLDEAPGTSFSSDESEFVSPEGIMYTSVPFSPKILIPEPCFTPEMRPHSH